MNAGEDLDHRVTSLQTDAEPVSSLFDADEPEQTADLRVHRGGERKPVSLAKVVGCALLFPFLLIGFVALANLVFVPPHSVKILGTDWLQVTRFIPALASICFFLGIGSASLLAMDRPKRIKLVNDGFTVCLENSRDSDFVRWDWVEKVRLDHRRDLLGSRDYSVAIHTTSGASVKFRWRDLIVSMPPANFFNALRTWAPVAVQRLEIPEELLSAQSIGIPMDGKRNAGYTELWLKYFSPPTSRERTEDLTPATKLAAGRYEVVGRLGGGGQGNTYLASCAPAASGAAAPDVVLKEYILPVHRGLTVLKQVEDKLNNEVNILQRIDHPQIVKLLDSFSEDYRGYLVLEYVQGKSLKEVVTLQGPQSQEFVIDVALQLCGVIRYLHQLSPPIVHRDVTPENIMLQPNNMVKLVDFNVAHQLESVATATIVGKHAYLPPEQFRGKPTTQSDIYALGCTIFFLLTGQDPEPISASHPREVNKSVSKHLDDVVAKATNPDVEKRYKDIDAMAVDLKTR